MVIVAADTSPLSCCVTGSYNAHVSHNYRFKRGDPVRIGWGRYAGATGVVDSAVFQKTVDYPDDYSAGYTWCWKTKGSLRCDGTRFVAESS